MYTIRNIIYEKVKQAGNMTDTGLIRALEKEDNSISWPALKWYLSFREPTSRDFRQSTSFYLDVLSI